MRNNLTSFERRCLRAVCVKPADCAMALAVRMGGRTCMADCWIALEHLRRAGRVYLTSRGNYAATPQGRHENR